jgi:hypothetical protein
MNWIKQNIYHLIGLLSVVLLFIFSLFIRQENLSEPLSRHHEWITAHTLITCEIWEKNGGPSAYHFSPVYTYPGEGNARRKMLGGVVDDAGNVYYVSYPPFAFLFAYYSTKLLGGPSVDSIRTLNLILHLICALGIYFLAVSFFRNDKKHYYSLAGITGSFLYLFSTGNLWIHGNLYFSDMLVQVFIILGLLLLSRFLNPDIAHKKWVLFGFFILFFLATYTEWLGLFFSFFTGLILLASYFIKKEIRYLKAFGSIAVASSLALALTLFQYSSIAGWDKFKEVSSSKYEERSGHASEELSPNAFNLSNDEAYDFMIGRIDRNYLMAENYLGIFGIILVIFFLVPNFRRGIGNGAQIISTVIPLVLAVLLHYYLFFNFNSLHDFSSLKTGFVMILFIVIFISLLESVLSFQIKLGLLALLLFLSISKGIIAVKNYYEDYPLSEIDWDRISTGQAMRKYGRPEAAIFMNISSNPELVYEAGHNVFPLQDTSELILFMNHFDNDQGQYYHHRGTKLEFIQEFERRNGRIVFTQRFNLSGHDTGEGKSHQK